jgi:hypothetical protein
MAVPYDQELRQQRFIQAHPQWSIHAQDEATHFTAEKADGTTRHNRRQPVPVDAPGPAR